MHGYSTDSGERRVVPLLLASVAIALAWVPNLAGRRHGYLVSSFDGREKRHHLVISIFQSWTHLVVFLTTATSMSRSCAAVIQVDDPEGVALIYQYQNQQLVDAMKTMHMHYGTAMLSVSNGGCLVGEYYAGRDRGTFGRICCRRQLRSPKTDPESVYTVSGAKGVASIRRIMDILRTVKLAD